MIVYAATAVVLILLDQLTKLWAQGVLSGGSALPFVPHVLEFLYVENRGIAFGMLQNMHWLVIPFSLAVVAVCVGFAVYYHKKGSRVMVLAIVMIVSGAVGNLIDKFRLGYVVDFIHTVFMEFPVFNLADVFICVGAAVMAVYILFFDKEEKDENHK